MDYNFDTTIEKATKKIENKLFIPEEFNEIYPFTTENINGYLDIFELENKSLLTVGSSIDQVINATLMGCKNITLLDINPFTKMFYYLKVSALITLTKDEFLSFLRYKDYPRTFVDNNDVLNINLYQKIKSTLKALNEEAYNFWNIIFDNYTQVQIRTNLFSMDENKTHVIEESNRYLNNNILYDEVKEKIKNINIDFIYGNILNETINKSYDNIWLSNIGTYLTNICMKLLTNKMYTKLNENGQILICYLYETTKDTKYQKGWYSIYDLNNTFYSLKKYNPELYTFKGIEGIKFNEEKIKDSIILSRKRKDLT